MKKVYIFIFTFFIFSQLLMADSLFFDDVYNSFLLNETDYSLPSSSLAFNDNPLISLDMQRDNFLIFPSTASFLKKGSFYVDLNAHNVGFVYPDKSRKTMFLFNQYIDNFSIYQKANQLNVKTVVGFSHKFSNFLYFGSNLNYVFKKIKTVVHQKFENFEIKSNSSVTLNFKNWTFDSAVFLGYQYKEMFLFDFFAFKNVSATFNERAIWSVNKYFKWSTSATLGIFKNSNAIIGLGSGENVLESLLGNVKTGVIFLPASFLKISSYVAFVGNSYDATINLDNSKKDGEISEKKLIMGSFAEIKPFRHCYFKTGINKIVVLSHDEYFDNSAVEHNLKDADAKNFKDFSKSENNEESVFAYYFGFGYIDDNFKIELVVNTDAFAKGSYFISGNPSERSALLFSTVEYSW